MKKKLTLSKAKDKAWKEFSKYIRLRDCLETTNDPEWGKCFTCGKLHAFKDLQAGHFTQGRHNSTLFLENNCHAQCRGCNLFKNGNLVEYTRKMIDRYGMETVDMLRDLNHGIEKRTVDDLVEIARCFKKKTEELG